VLVSCGGGIGSYEDLMNAQGDLMSEMVNVLEGVNDQDSAETAASKIEAIGSQMAELAQKAQDLPKPSADEMQKIAKKQTERTQVFQEKAAGQMMKLVQYPVLGEAWMKALESAR